jgi:hypothetical protein
VQHDWPTVVVEVAVQAEHRHAQLIVGQRLLGGALPRRRAHERRQEQATGLEDAMNLEQPVAPLVGDVGED